MKKFNNNLQKFDKKKLLREQDHLTRPPRLEGAVKNEMMNPVKKDKKKITNPPYHRESKIHIDPQNDSDYMYPSYGEEGE